MWIEDFSAPAHEGSDCYQLGPCCERIVVPIEVLRQLVMEMEMEERLKREMEATREKEEEAGKEDEAKDHDEEEEKEDDAKEEHAVVVNLSAMD